VILDEPTNGLDPAARTRMLQLVREMKEQHGMSVVMCSHLLRDVEEICDEVVILNDGRIVHHADLEEERRANRRFVELDVSGDDSRLADALREQNAEGVTEGLTWEALGQVGMNEAAHRKVAAYSKGMRQRVRLAQAIAHNPEVIILDEPLNGLDPLARA